MVNQNVLNVKFHKPTFRGEPVFEINQSGASILCSILFLNGDLRDLLNSCQRWQWHLLLGPWDMASLTPHDRTCEVRLWCTGMSSWVPIWMNRIQQGRKNVIFFQDIRLCSVPNIALVPVRKPFPKSNVATFLFCSHVLKVPLCSLSVSRSEHCSVRSFSFSFRSCPPRKKPLGALTSNV